MGVPQSVRNTTGNPAVRPILYITLLASLAVPLASAAGAQPAAASGPAAKARSQRAGGSASRPPARAARTDGRDAASSSSQYALRPDSDGGSSFGLKPKFGFTPRDSGR